jgi:DNA-binding NarL/FixJ family response regulator
MQGFARRRGRALSTSSVRVLVVDDYDAWRRHICLVLKTQKEIQVIAEARDGLEAVQKAQELRPDLILLDIGLPTLNGIEAARRIRNLSPQSKVLFITQETSADIVLGALATGAAGYVVKTDVRTELLTALEAVSRGEKYVSTRLADRVSTKASVAGARPDASIGTFATEGSSLRSARETGHVVNFHTDDAALLDGLSSLIGDSVGAGESAVAVMTSSHRSGLEKRLIAQRFEVSEAINNGRLAIYDADQALSQFMDAAGPSRERFLLQFGDIVRRARAAAVAKNRRVVIFGEMVAVLWAREQYEAAIRLEGLWNELALTCPFYLCCAYPANGFPETLARDSFAAVCAQHSDVVSSF